MVVADKNPVAVDMVRIAQRKRNFVIEIPYHFVLGEVPGHDGARLESKLLQLREQCLAREACAGAIPDHAAGAEP